MSQKDSGITSFNRKEFAGYAEAKAEAAREAENREAAFAFAVLLFGALSGLTLLFGFADLSDTFVQKALLASVIFGIIEVPRLEEVNLFTRLMMVTMMVGELVLFIRMLLPQMMMDVSIGALGLLFLATMVNVSAQKENKAGDARQAVVKNAPYLGIGVGMGVLSILGL